MIRVLHVLPDLAFGGTEKMICTYQGSMPKDDVQFDYVTHGLTQDYHAQLKRRGSTIFYFKTIGRIGLLNYYRQICGHIRIREYDIVHVHTGDIVGIYSLLYKLAGAKKIICHAHVTSFSKEKFCHIQRVLRFVANIVADKKLACGSKAGDFCFGKNSNFTILPNAIETSVFESINNAEVARVKKEIGIKRGVHVVGHVGNFYWQKNHMFLIDSFYLLKKEMNNVVLVLVGDGPEKEKCVKHVKELGIGQHVVFCGTRTDVFNFYLLFDLFCMPSISEGFAISALEAQASGCKCILSDNMDHEVDMCMGNTCFLPIKNGEKIWAEKMVELLKDNTNNRQRCIEEFKNSTYSVRNSSNTLIRIYKELTLR